jgi:hypothetical protein
MYQMVVPYSYHAQASRFCVVPRIDNKDIQHPEGCGHHSEKVARHNAFGVIPDERCPVTRSMEDQYVLQRRDCYGDDHSPQPSDDV